MATSSLAGSREPQVNLMPYMTCFECGTEYATPQDLVERHLAVLAEIGIVEEPRDGLADTITVCPNCSHDF